MCNEETTVKKMSREEIKPRIKEVLMIHMGGTIGAKTNENGVYVPVAGRFLTKLKSIPILHDPDLLKKCCPDNESTAQLVLPQMGNTIVKYKFQEEEILLDSSNMGPDDWIKIATFIFENDDDNIDAFVILNGTDTMALTASALSFMIEGLRKPVIITGSQISIFDARSDAINNVLSSLLLSACYAIPEVCIFFGNKLLRANRSTKVYLNELNAFQSPNYGVLAEIGVDIKVYSTRLMKPMAEKFAINTNLCRDVGILRIYPTLTPDILQNVVKSLKGLVLQTYGAGNFPSNQKELLKILKEAVDREVLIINTTLCLQGTVVGTYETGQVLDDVGIISGYDMTVEAAYTKLCVVLGYPDLSYNERVQLMEKNIRGELTRVDNNNNINNFNHGK